MDQSNSKPYFLPAESVWFVTGCSSGIGLAISKLLASTKQHRIVATARNPAALSSSSSGLPDGPNVLKLTLDVTSTSSIERALNETIAKFGRIDVLVNNAGYTLVGDTENATDQEARALFDTNFWGMVDITKKVLGLMRDGNIINSSTTTAAVAAASTTTTTTAAAAAAPASSSGGGKGGVILNISSMGGFTGFPGSAFYHASKFAVEGWTEAVAKELPSQWNIHLSNVEPGGVKTNYATTSLKHMVKGRHLAYRDDPTFPTNALLRYMSMEENRRSWADPDAIATAIYRIVSRGQRIPIRVPLGSDAFGMISLDLENVKKDLDEVKDISLAVSRDSQQLESIDFLRKA